MTMNFRTENFEANYTEIRERHHREDLAAQERGYKLIADGEAARVARGEPRQPPYVPQPGHEAYRARARVLMAQLSETASSTLAQ